MGDTLPYETATLCRTASAPMLRTWFNYRGVECGPDGFVLEAFSDDYVITAHGFMEVFPL
jgi:hypothetical protein